MEIAGDAWFPLVLWVVWFSGTLAATIISARVWVGDKQMMERGRDAFALAMADDPEKARAMVRGFPMIVIACWGIAISVVPLLYEEFTNMGDPLGPSTWWALVGGGLCLLFAGVGLDLAIIYFNRPRFLVPPHVRWEPGYQEVVAARERGENVDTFYEARRVAWEQRRSRRRSPS